MFEKTGAHCVLILALLSFAALHCSQARRDLKDIDFECCENGFLFNSSFLTIDIKKGDVKIRSPLGDLELDDDGVVIDTPLLQVNTRERVLVEVAGGEVLNITTADDGTTVLTVGKDGAVVSLLVEADGKATGTVGKEEIVIDFSDKENGISVDVGENGKIVDVETDGEGNGQVLVGEDGKIAKVSVSGKNVTLSFGDDDNEEGEEEKGEREDQKKEKKEKKENKQKKEKKLKEEISEDDGETVVETDGESVAVVRLLGTEVIGAEVEEIS